MSSEDEKRYFDMIENNDNVSETSVGKEFSILVGGIVGICVVLFFCADFLAGFYIDNMPPAAQVKLERTLTGMSSAPNVSPKEFRAQIDTLNDLKQKLKRQDKKLNGMSDFNIGVHSSDEVNAFVVPDGSIYFTKGLLKEVKDEQVLAFVLAHEMGHYVHRDHLKSFGREIIADTLLTLATAGQSQHLSSLVNNISELSQIVYSRSQETKADLYANAMVLRLYGTNKGAVEFMKMIDEKQKLPQFVHYFSTHPSPQDRIHLLEQDAKKRGF